MFAGNSADESGGAIFLENCPFNATNLSIAGNSAGAAGGGLALTGHGTSSLLINSIVWNNDAPANPQMIGEYKASFVMLAHEPQGL